MAHPVTFLSDYGYEDEFAGVCRAVIARLAPDAAVIDLTHGIPPCDVRSGAFVLAAALPHCPQGVHLAVVDPGVGTARRPVAVAVADSSRVLVGPDNGVLWPALERFGGAGTAIDLGRSPHRLEPVSATFHGRDLFSPVAAALAGGAALEEAGEEIDPATLVRIGAHPPRVEENRVSAHVAYRDRFGNATLELTRAELPAELFQPGESICLDLAGDTHEATFGHTFADAPEGGLLVYEDSTGSVAIAVNGGSAAERLGLAAEVEVTLRRSGSRERAGG